MARFGPALQGWLGDPAHHPFGSHISLESQEHMVSVPDPAQCQSIIDMNHTAKIHHGEHCVVS